MLQCLPFPCYGCLTDYKTCKTLQLSLLAQTITYINSITHFKWQLSPHIESFNVPLERVSTKYMYTAYIQSQKYLHLAISGNAHESSTQLICTSLLLYASNEFDSLCIVHFNSVIYKLIDNNYLNSYWRSKIATERKRNNHKLSVRAKSFSFSLSRNSCATRCFICLMWSGLISVSSIARASITWTYR